ncbi:MAG: hypothetical protein AABW65_00335 [Nanoarchaeota archaeon]
MFLEHPKVLNKPWAKAHGQTQGLFDFALALKLDCAIWSNDKKLNEQDKVKIYSTEDLIELLK